MDIKRSIKGLGRRGIFCPSQLTWIVVLTTVSHYRARCDGTIMPPLKTTFIKSVTLCYRLSNGHQIIITVCR